MITEYAGVIDSLNNAGELWWSFVFHATWQSAVVATIVATLVSVGRRLPSQLRHALLLLALAKFASPPMLSLPTGLFSLVDVPGTVNRSTGVTPIAAIEEDPVDVETGSYPIQRGQTDCLSLPACDPVLTWQAWFLLGHMVGAVIVGSAIFVRLARLRQTIRRAQAVTHGGPDLLLRRVCSQMRIRRPPRLLVSTQNVPPLAFGPAELPQLER